MNRLADRNRQIPNGFKFFEPATKWSPPDWASFDTIVRLLISHRSANPGLVQQLGWSLDYNTVANEVEAFNVKICEQHGWTGFLINQEGTGEPPKSSSPHLAPLRGVAVGAETLVEWIRNGAEAVPPIQAAKRAGVCVTCPLNEKGDWTSFFTVPVSMAIRKLLDRKREWKLTTPFDEKLHVCAACLCPLPLMVHVPARTKWDKMTDEAKAALWSECWLPKEINANVSPDQKT